MEIMRHANQDWSSGYTFFIINDEGEKFSYWKLEDGEASITDSFKDTGD